MSSQGCNVSWGCSCDWNSVGWGCNVTAGVPGGWVPGAVCALGLRMGDKVISGVPSKGSRTMVLKGDPDSRGCYFRVTQSVGGPVSWSGALIN